MSRIGKAPVPVPSNVQARVEGQIVFAKGPKGELSFEVIEDCLVEMKESEIHINPRTTTKRAHAMWGMSRTRVQNIVKGVSEGFEKHLAINGVGYRAAVQGKDLQLSLGFSHEVKYSVPQGIEIRCPKPTEIVVFGIDKQKVGQVSAEIRRFRPPEPYKGKGIKYADEFIFRKESKKK